eukprot:gene10036-10192_t
MEGKIEQQINSSSHKYQRHTLILTAAIRGFLNLELAYLEFKRSESTKTAGHICWGGAGIFVYCCNGVYEVAPKALLEYHCFPPLTPPSGPAALIRLFSGFWGSAAPRIGEAGARGWAYWCLWHSMGMEQPAAAAVEQRQDQDEQQEGLRKISWSPGVAET